MLNQQRLQKKKKLKKKTTPTDAEKKTSADEEARIAKLVTDITHVQSGMLKIGAYYAACLIDHCRLTGEKMTLADKWKNEWTDGLVDGEASNLQFSAVTTTLGDY